MSDGSFLFGRTDRGSSLPDLTWPSESASASLGHHHGARRARRGPRSRYPAFLYIRRLSTLRAPVNRHVRRRLGGRRVLDQRQQAPAQAAALEVRAPPSAARRPRLPSPASRPRTAPTSRPPATATVRRPLVATPRRTSSNDSPSAGMSTPGLAYTSCSQQARCSVNSSPASPGLARRGSRGRARPATDAAGSRSGRRCGGTAYRLLVPPGGDRARGRRDSSTGGHLAAAPRGRLGVDGVLEQAVLVRLLDERLRVAHEAGQQPHDRLDDRQRGDLAAVEHVVAERQLAHRRTRVAASSTTRWSMPS